MSARKVKVQVKPGCIVYVDGTAYQAGQVVEVPADEAKTLLEQGVAEKA